MLQKKFACGDHLEKKIMVDVWLLETKKIVFTGSVREVTKFCGIKDNAMIAGYISKKWRVKKTWALRISKQIPC